MRKSSFAARLARGAHHGAVVIALTGSAVVACSSSPKAGDTSDAGPLSCDAGVPSYKSDIVPILNQTCLACHNASGGTGFPFDTYAEVSNQAGEMLGQIVDGQMPPSNAPPLTAAQRTPLLDWLECGAPDN
jgi:uncharacterized membrane protein